MTGEDSGEYLEAAVQRLLTEDGAVTDQGIEVVRREDLLILRGEVESPHRRDEILRIAEALQPDCLSVLFDPSYAGSIDEAVEPFAQLCAKAATDGHRCALEFFAWSPLRTLGDAWRIVAEAGAPNSGLIFDTWHHFRVGGTAADLGLLVQQGHLVVGVLQPQHLPGAKELHVVEPMFNSRGFEPNGMNPFASPFGSFVHHLLPSGKRMTMRLLVRSGCVVSHRKFLGGWTK